MYKRLNVTFINSISETKQNMVGHFLDSRATINDEPTQVLRLAGLAYLVSDVLQGRVMTVNF